MAIRLLLLMCIGIYCGTSCAPILYTPPAQTVPLPSKKGDGSLTGSWGLRGLNLQYAGAVSKDYLVFASFRHTKYERQSDAFLNLQSSTAEHREISGELGLGRYGRLGQKRSWGWSVVGGHGWGRSREDPGSGNAFARSFARYYRTFLQPAFGYAGTRFDIALSCQGAWIAIGPVESSKVTLNGSNISAWSLEPALTLSAGGEDFRFFTQFAVTRGNDAYNQAAGIYSWEESGTYCLALGIQILLGKSGDLIWFGRENK